MKNHTEKKEAVIATFKAYRTNRIDKYELKAYLEDIQYQIFKSESITIDAIDFDYNPEDSNCESEMWFKFFKGDTLATTINDIIKDLDCPTNGKYILRNLDSAITEKQLEIYFS